MGVDASGIVEQAPAGSRFKKGSRVVVRKTDFAPGALCEYTAAQEADTALVGVQGVPGQLKGAWDVG